MDVNLAVLLFVYGLAVCSPCAVFWAHWMTQRSRCSDGDRHGRCDARKSRVCFEALCPRHCKEIHGKECGR